MKLIFLSLVLFLGLTSSAFAAKPGGGGGDNAGNGGDICENRIINIAADFEIWLSDGGGFGLEFPYNITLATYKEKMLRYIRTAKISCVAENIYIGRAEKTCKNIIDHQGIARITCNDARFLKLNSNDQYVLIHHEFAGLSGFEVNTGETSEYRLSNQISEYLRDIPSKKLSVRSPALDLVDPFNAKSCEGKPFTMATLNSLDISLPPYNDYGDGYARKEWSQLSFATRERRCSKIRGCSGWTTTPNQYAIDGYLMPVPDRGQIIFSINKEGPAVLFETLRQGNKFGINVYCGLLSKFNGDCVVYSSGTHATTTAKAVFNERCSRVVIFQREEMMTKDRDDTIWIDREIVLSGKY
jgi:hypothetical protein